MRSNPGLYLANAFDVIYYLTHWLVMPPPLMSFVLPLKKLSQPELNAPPASATPVSLLMNEDIEERAVLAPALMPVVLLKRVVPISVAPEFAPPVLLMPF